MHLGCEIIDFEIEIASKAKRSNKKSIILSCGSMKHHPTNKFHQFKRRCLLIYLNYFYLKKKAKEAYPKGLLNLHSKHWPTYICRLFLFLLLFKFSIRLTKGLLLLVLGIKPHWCWNMLNIHETKKSDGYACEIDLF